MPRALLKAARSLVASPDVFFTLASSLELFGISFSLIRVSSSREIVDYPGGGRGGGQKGGLRKRTGARRQKGRSEFSTGSARKSARKRCAKTAGRTMKRSGKKIEIEMAAKRSRSAGGEKAPRVLIKFSPLMVPLQF
jgi:hypothetical protein